MNKYIPTDNSEIVLKIQRELVNLASSDDAHVNVTFESSFVMYLNKH